jgi:hypothetical protein
MQLFLDNDARVPSSEGRTFKHRRRSSCSASEVSIQDQEICRLELVI